MKNSIIFESTVVDTKFGPPNKKWPPEKWSMLSADYHKNFYEIILNSTYNN